MKQGSGGLEFGSFCLAGHLRVAGFWHSLSECADGDTPIHAAPLIGELGIVSLEVIVEHGLHLLDGLEPGAPSLEPEMLVELGGIEAFKDAGLATLSFVFEGCVTTPSNPLPRGPATANRARRLLRSTPGSVGDLGQVAAVKGHIANRKRASHPRFPKASGLWWVGFRAAKALSDLALTQPSPSKPLAFAAG